MGTSLAIDRKTGQRRMVLAYEILFLLFSNGVVCSDVMNDIIQSLTTYTLIIKQALLKYSDSYIFNWHSKFANCLTLPKVDILPYILKNISMHRTPIYRYIERNITIFTTYQYIGAIPRGLK